MARTWIVLLLALIVLAVLFIGAFRTFLFQTFEVSSSSMEPSLQEGDHIVADKYAYGYSRHSSTIPLPLPDRRIFAREPEPGDVVVFQLPRDSTITFVQRVVAGPGDRVEMRNGVLHINGEAVDLGEPLDTAFDIDGFKVEGTRWTETLPNGARYQIYDAWPDALFDNMAEQTVPPGHYFMLGDNRDRSLDSRSLHVVGMVPADHIIGRISVVMWSGERDAFVWRSVRPNSDEP